MDGGIVDNQGIDSLLPYNEKLKEPLDMFMVVDISTATIKPYKDADLNPIKVIAAGQIITCLKMLEYEIELRQDNQNSQLEKFAEALEQSKMIWAKLKDNPYYLVIENGIAIRSFIDCKETKKG